MTKEKTTLIKKFPRKGIFPSNFIIVIIIIIIVVVVSGDVVTSFSLRVYLLVFQWVTASLFKSPVLLFVVVVVYWFKFLQSSS